MGCLGEEPKCGRGGITVVWRRNKYGRINEQGNKSRWPCVKRLWWVLLFGHSLSCLPTLFVLSSSQPPFLTPILCAWAYVCGETTEWKPCVTGSPPGVAVEQLERMERSKYFLVIWGCGPEGLKAWGSCTWILWVCISTCDHWSGHTSGEWEMRPWAWIGYWRG